MRQYVAIFPTVQYKTQKTIQNKRSQPSMNHKKGILLMKQAARSIRGKIGERGPSYLSSYRWIRVTKRENCFNMPNLWAFEHARLESKIIISNRCVLFHYDLFGSFLCGDHLAITFLCHIQGILLFFGVGNSSQAGYKVTETAAAASSEDFPHSFGSIWSFFKSHGSTTAQKI